MGRFDSAQRTRILDAAIPVFARLGIDGASIRDIAKSAGINSALLYYYFENKDTLFVEAVRFVIRGLVDFLDARRSQIHDGPSRVAFLVHGILDYSQEHPERMDLASLALVRHPDLIGKSIEGFVRENVPLPLEVLREGMARGEIRRGHPMQIWWGILGMCYFSLQMPRAMKHVEPAALPVPLPTPEERRGQILETLCNGLVLPPSPPLPSGTKKKAPRS